MVRDDNASAGFSSPPTAPTALSTDDAAYLFQLVGRLLRSQSSESARLALRDWLIRVCLASDTKAPTRQSQAWDHFAKHCPEVYDSVAASVAHAMRDRKIIVDEVWLGLLHVCAFSLRNC
jgi:predicted LPLAT superfamily acyltransferase